MKKLAIIALLASAATMASAATEVELHGGRNFGVDQNFTGLSVGHRVGKHALTLGFDHASKWDRWSLVGSRDITTLGPVIVDAKLGLAHVDPDHRKSGWAGTIGLGATLPIAPRFSLVADVAYQKGQHKIERFDGAVASAGVRYTF